MQYTPEQLKAMNDKTVTYNGKEMSYYDATQQQRAIERKIREWKRKAAGAEGSGEDPSFAQSKVKYWQGVQRDFTRKTGLKRDYFRERAGKQNEPNISADESDNASEKLTYLGFDKDIDVKYKKAVIQRYDSGSELAKKVYNKNIPKDGAVVENVANRSYHLSGGVHLDYTKDLLNPRGSGTSWFHEHAHYLDWKCGRISHSFSFRRAIIEDAREYEKVFMASKGYKSITTARWEIGKELTDTGDITHAIQDILGGVIKDIYPHAIWKHRKEYWKKQGVWGLSSEAFAHMFEAEFSPEKMKLMKTYFPNAWREFEKIIERLI